jgi:hypothetical protein
MMNPSHNRRPLFGALLVLGVVFAAASAQHEDLHHAEVEGYESISGGQWVRGPNITGEEGNPFVRQEQSVARLNGFIYLINGLIPVDPPRQPTEDEPDPEHPGLEETHTGYELSSRVIEIERMVSNETFGQFPDDSVYSVEVRSVSFDHAEDVEMAYLDVCTVTDRQEVSRRTGQVLPRTEGVRTIEATGVMHLVDGIWKLAEYEDGSSQEGIAGCAVD